MCMSYTVHERERKKNKERKALTQTPKLCYAYQHINHAILGVTLVFHTHLTKTPVLKCHSQTPSECM